MEGIYKLSEIFKNELTEFWWFLIFIKIHWHWFPKLTISTRKLCFGWLCFCRRSSEVRWLASQENSGAFSPLNQFPSGYKCVSCYLWGITVSQKAWTSTGEKQKSLMESCLKIISFYTGQIVYKLWWINESVSVWKQIDVILKERET